MSDSDRNTTVVSSSGNGGLYFIVGMLVIAVLVGAYVLIGMPGLHTQVANAPGVSTTSSSNPPANQKVDITVQQPAQPAAPARPERR